jgi:hypothetical protein
MNARTAKLFDLLKIAAALGLCYALLQATYPVRSEWPGIPTAPDRARAHLYGFGDTEFSYRTIGMMLQNAGDVGGRVTSLMNYDFRIIRDWLWLSYTLDSQSNYVPSLAAYYFGSTQKKEELKYLVDYLAKVGQDDGAERWRWLAHAVFIARFEMKNQEKALELAEKLAAVDQPDMPIWTKQMPAYVMANVGKKKAARDLMLTIAATDKTIDPAEINQTCWFINTKLREKGDDLDHNEIYKALCSHEWDTTPKTNKSN